MDTPSKLKIPKVIAHRGASGSAPENTLAAIARAGELGSPAIEFDATISSDGVGVIHHDADVERCTDGSGPIVLKSMDDISQLDAGSWFADEFSGERIPTLEDALKTVIQHNMFLNLEIKPSLGLEEATARITADVVKKIWPEGSPLLASSMSETALDTFRQLMPEVPRGLIYDTIPENWHERLQHHDCVSLHCNYEFITDDLSKKVHDAGYKLLAFTVDDPEIAKKLFAMGVDGIFTNFPEIILPIAQEVAPEQE